MFEFIRPYKTIFVFIKYLGRLGHGALGTKNSFELHKLRSHFLWRYSRERASGSEPGLNPSQSSRRYLTSKLRLWCLNECLTKNWYLTSWHQLKKKIFRSPFHPRKYCLIIIQFFRSQVANHTNALWWHVYMVFYLCFYHLIQKRMFVIDNVTIAHILTYFDTFCLFSGCHHKFKIY